MRFLFAGGGTGGHLFPGLALAKTLQAMDADADILFVGSREGLETTLVPDAGYTLECIAIGRGAPVSWRRPLNLPRFFWSLAQADRLVRRYQPQAVVALGGFAAAVPGLIARIRHIPLFLLEQNTVPGRVTRLLAPCANEIYLQFAEAVARMKTTTRMVYSGSPLREELLALTETPWEGRDVLLVMGGSQGAQRLNELVVEAAPRIAGNTEAQVIHVAGAGNEDAVRKAYEAAGVNADVRGFCDDMKPLYARARMCIARAGAMSCAELALAGVPTLFVPLPSAKDDHQRCNAAAMARNYAAILLEQTILDARELAEVAVRLWNNEARLRTMHAAMREHAKPDAAAVIADRIVGQLGELQ